jgi:hypothetical protein
VWEKDDELRKEGGGVGKNGGLLMRGKGCWRLGGSVTEISKNRETAGGWLRLEDEGMKKRWKGRGAGVFFGRLRGRRKTKGKSWTRGEGTVGAVVGSLSLCFFRPLCLSPLLFFRLRPPFIGKESLAVIMVSGTSHKTCPIISAIYCKPYPCFDAENGFLLRRQQIMLDAVSKFQKN